MELTIEQKRAIAMASARMRMQGQAQTQPQTPQPEPQPEGGGMFSDVVPEIKKEFSDNLETFKEAGRGRGEKGVLQGFLDTGKAALAVPGMIAAPITGAARSLIGHPMASAIHGIGSIINPEVAAKQTHDEIYQDAKGGVDKAMMAARPANMGARGPLPLPARTPAASELKQAATQVWNSQPIKSIQIQPQDVSTLSAKIESELLSKGHRPTNASAPGTFAEIKRMVPGQGVSTVGVDDLRAARQALRETAGLVGPDFRATPDAKAAKTAIDRIDDFLDTLSPSLREANANYAAGRRAEALDFRTMQADHRAAKTGSGSNIENTMRQEVDKIGNRGLSPQEIAARDRIVEGSKTRNALRKVGKLGVSDGLSLLLHAGAAGGTGGYSVPVAVAGTAARKIGELLTRRDIANLNKMIRSRSPLAQVLAAHPQIAKVPNGTKAVAAALLAQAPSRTPMLQGALPAYAEERE